MPRAPKKQRSGVASLGAVGFGANLGELVQNALDKGSLDNLLKNLPAKVNDEDKARLISMQAYLELFEAPDKLGIRPIDLEKKEIEFPDAKGDKHYLPPGFYLVTGSTGAGKSINMAALAAHIFLNSKVDMPARYVYMYEARGPDLSAGDLGPANWIRLFSAILGITKDDTKFGAGSETNASVLATRLKLNAFVGKLGDGEPRLLVLDSLSLPMRAHSRNADGRKGESTMSGGLQPSDVDFTVAMEAMAVAKNLVILGIVNNDLVPFVDKLEGVTEGLVSVEGPGMLRYRQRSDRKLTYCELPKRAVDLGAEFLHYPERQVADIFDLTGYVAG